MPIVRIAAPEGITYTAFADEMRGRDACDGANVRFLEPLLQQCPQCKTLFERCVGKQQAIELQLAAQRSYSVSMPGLRIVVDGPAAPAKLACEQVAADLAKHGVAQGRCAPPRAPN